MVEPAPAEPCEMLFEVGLPLGDSAEVALEDYARALTAAAGAEAVRSGSAESRVVGVRLIAPALGATPEARRDIQDFARGLAVESGGAGLGWA